MCAAALVVLFVIAVLAVPALARGRRAGLDPDRAHRAGVRRGASAVASAAGRRRMHARVLVQPDVRHVRTHRHHAVPRIRVADWKLPDKVGLLADIAHVRRGRVLRFAQLGRVLIKSRLMTAT
jgi:hypothetical protein